MARPERGSDDGWFRIGTVDVTTSVLVVVLAVLSVIEWAFEGNLGPLQSHLSLDPDAAVTGQVWRLLTWPLAYPGGIGVFDVFVLALFWYFGTEVERLLGKKRMAWFLGLVTVGLGLLWVAVVEVSTLYGVLSSLNQVELMVLLVFIAEYPHRRFFFNIPGWVIAVVLIGISVLGYIGNREWLLLLDFALGLVLTAVVARSLGLLSEITWIPKVQGRARTRKPKRSRGAPKGGPGTVVAGPWQPREVPPVSRDQAALDALLDKISASGMDSLTDHEREQLMVLRDRLRRRP
jgi:hypothetical protein